MRVPKQGVLAESMRRSVSLRRHLNRVVVRCAFCFPYRHTYGTAGMVGGGYECGRERPHLQHLHIAGYRAVRCSDAGGDTGRVRERHLASSAGCCEGRSAVGDGGLAKPSSGVDRSKEWTIHSATESGVDEITDRV